MPFNNVGINPPQPAPSGPFGQNLAPPQGGMGKPPDLMSLLRQIAAMKGVPVEYLLEELERRKKAMAQGQQPVGSMGMGGAPSGSAAGVPGFGQHWDQLTGGGDIAALVAQAMSGTRR